MLRIQRRDHYRRCRWESLEEPPVVERWCSQESILWGYLRSFTILIQISISKVLRYPMVHVYIDVIDILTI
jgi:hypothetical protein